MMDALRGAPRAPSVKLFDAPEEERVAWLYDWWERIDAWIEENRPASRPLTTDWAARRSARIRL